MSLTVNGFEILARTSPEEKHYSKKKQKLRGVKEVLIISRRRFGNTPNIEWEDKIYEHEFIHITESINPRIIVKWLLRFDLKKEADKLYFHLQKESPNNPFRIEILFLFSKWPTNRFLKFLVNRIEKSSSIEILSNVSRAPKDKIYLELGKFYLSRKILEDSATHLISIIDRPGADWRSFYRACYLLSYIYAGKKNYEYVRKYNELLRISNPNFPKQKFDESLLFK